MIYPFLWMRVSDRLISLISLDLFLTSGLLEILAFSFILELSTGSWAGLYTFRLIFCLQQWMCLRRSSYSITLNFGVSWLLQQLGRCDSLLLFRNTYWCCALCDLLSNTHTMYAKIDMAPFYMTGWKLLRRQLFRWQTVMLTLTLRLTLPWTKRQMTSLALTLWRRRYHRRNSCRRSKCRITNWIWQMLSKTARPLRARTRCGQDAESNFVNPHSFRNLSAYSWTCPQPVLIPSGLLPRTLLQSIQREQWFLHLSADRMPKWHNLLPQPVLILSALYSGRPPEGELVFAFCLHYCSIPYTLPLITSSTGILKRTLILPGLKTWTLYIKK